MKKYGMLSIAAGILISLFSGCQSPVPKPPEAHQEKITLAANPRIRIICTGNNDIAAHFADAVRQRFVKRGGVSVNENPRYFIVIFAESRHRADQPAENEYNVIVEKTSRSDAYGGEEFVTSRKFTTSANSFFVSAAVYEVGTMTPLLYFDMPFYSGGTSGLTAPAAAAQKFASRLSKLVEFGGRSPRKKY